MRRGSYVFKKSTYLPNDINLNINRSKEGFDAPLHRHEFIEIIFIEEGKGFHYINNDTIRVNKGDIFIIPMGVEHVLRPINDNYQLVIYNVLFSLDYVREVFEEISKFQDKTLLEWLSSNIMLKDDKYLYLQDTKMHCVNVVRYMFLEKQKRNTGYRLMLDAKLKELFILLSRLDCVDGKNSVEFPKEMEVVISYVAEHFNKPITIAEMSGLAHVSERHFSRIFKHYMNQSFTQYLQTIRIEKSCELLVKTNLTITEICLCIGYKNVDFFRELFLKKVGQTPTKYRTKNTSINLTN